ncbi:embryonic polyadenylate-binding protein 2 isoform X2 [Cebus imitator]|uniref:embryonic polyadenylate-binding protein 2 isoform X2 n=1 Tax=Cebus imitator TaxID=2715852 RepID=UPI00189BEC7C|nr:embryonic polyadenylate-binding protein 2 isoform X2 [Cebus imitator]
MWCLCRVVSVPCGCCLGVNLGTDAGSRELQCGWVYAEETNQLHSASPSSRESPRGACPRDRERQGPRSQGWKLSPHSAFANGPVGAAGLRGRLKTPAGPRQVRTREEWREASPGPPSSCPSTMWPVPSCSLFPPPTQAWLQTVSSDPEAQGWGAWNKTKNSLEPEGGEGKEEREGEAEEDQDGDEGFLLSLLEQDSLAEFPMPDQELEAIKMKVWAMEQAEGLPQPPGAQRREEEDAVAGQLLSPEAAGHPIPGTPEEKVEADHRSVYVGNLCLHRVCHQGLCAGRHAAGPEPLPRPRHQGAAEKNQLPWDQLHRPRGTSRTPRLQGATLPPQQPPGQAPVQTTRAEPGTWKSLTVVLTVLIGGPAFERGTGGWVPSKPVVPHRGLGPVGSGVGARPEERGVQKSSRGPPTWPEGNGPLMAIVMSHSHGPVVGWARVPLGSKGIWAVRRGGKRSPGSARPAPAWHAWLFN